MNDLNLQNYAVGMPPEDYNRSLYGRYVAKFALRDRESVEDEEELDEEENAPLSLDLEDSKTVRENVEIARLNLEVALASCKYINDPRSESLKMIISREVERMNLIYDLVRL